MLPRVGGAGVGWLFLVYLSLNLLLPAKASFYKLRNVLM